MSDQHNGDINNGNRPDMRDWEAQINDLLDGELSDSDAERLTRAAEGDGELARAIIEAYQLQQAMANIPLERAPASLRRKLKLIPRVQRRLERPAWQQPAWLGAVAAAALVAVVAIQQLGPQEPEQPSAAEIAQAQQDLKVVLTYLGKVRRQTGLEIESRVGEGMSEVVTGSMIKAVEDQMETKKETKA